MPRTCVLCNVDELALPSTEPQDLWIYKHEVLLPEPKDWLHLVRSSSQQLFSVAQQPEQDKDTLGQHVTCIWYIFVVTETCSQVGQRSEQEAEGYS